VLISDLWEGSGSDSPRSGVTLADAGDGGTDLTGTHENLPPGVPPQDNELGWSQSLDKLAALAEDGPLA
jgi:hypothetical protein